MRTIKHGTAALALAAVLACLQRGRPSSDRPSTDRPSTDRPSTDRLGSQRADDDATPTLAAGCQAVGYHRDELAPGCWAIQGRGLPDSPLAELHLPAGFTGNDPGSGSTVWTTESGVPSLSRRSETCTPTPARAPGNRRSSAPRRRTSPQRSPLRR